MKDEILIQWSRVLREKTKVWQLARNIPPYMKSRDYLPHAQKPFADLYSEPD
jgi:hypothetical protein